MKTIISILALLLGATGIFLTTEGKESETGTEDHRTCSCSGTFCSCDVTCLDLGEMPSCTCGTFSCICKCTPKDANNAVPTLPTMNTDQLDNSTKGEKYFRTLGSPPATSIADGIKNLREAILAADLKKYQSNASAIESAYAGLSPAQKTAWESWSSQNLKK